MELSTNKLIGTNPTAIKPALDRYFAGEKKNVEIPELKDEKAVKRIIKVLLKL